MARFSDIQETSPPCFWFHLISGVATIYAVKSAGLAIGIGIGSSFIVLVSFVWGIFVFDERVHSRAAACFAVFCMMLGLFGMSYYSSPESSSIVETDLTIHNNPTSYHSLEGGSSSSDDEVNNPDIEEVNEDALKLNENLKLTERTSGAETSSITSYGDDDDPAIDTEALSIGASSSLAAAAAATHDPSTVVMVNVRGYKIAKRKLGMMSAAFCGIWGGSIMAPMKFCKSDTKGTHYLMSFSIGASIVTVAFWLLRYLYNVNRYRSLSKAYAVLPSFHLRTMWLAGGTSGFLWSIGNFFSLISVFYLGEGVGYPLVQTSILVSGLWGIFYFREVQGTERITKWLCSSLITIFGILLLSYEHHEK